MVTTISIERRHANGFTVLELAIALAIAGLALVSLFELFSTTVITAARADRLTEATLLARSRLAEVETIEPLQLGTSSGTAPDGLVWRVEATQYAGESEHGVGSNARRLVSVVVTVLEKRATTATEGKPLVRLQTITFAALQ